MVRGRKTAPLDDDEKRQRQFSLSSHVSDLLVQEALVVQLTAPQFLRMLLRRKMGLEQSERPALAPARKPLTRADPEMEQFGCILPANLHRFLSEVCNRLGGASPSTVASHYILEWIGISPLSPGPISLPASARSKVTPPPRRGTGVRRTGSQPTGVQLLSVAAPLRDLLDQEAGYLGTNHAELVRSIMRNKAGIFLKERASSAPPRPLLADKEHEHVRYSITLPLDQIALLDRLAAGLGGGEKSAIVSHLVLEYFGISPLNLACPFEERTRLARSRTRSRG